MLRVLFGRSLLKEGKDSDLVLDGLLSCGLRFLLHLHKRLYGQMCLIRRFFVSRNMRGWVPLDRVLEVYRTVVRVVFITDFRFTHWFKQIPDFALKTARNKPQKKGCHTRDNLPKRKKESLLDSLPSVTPTGLKPVTF